MFITPKASTSKPVPQITACPMQLTRTPVSCVWPRGAGFASKRGLLRTGLLRAAWRTALCDWRWRKAGSFLPHSSFVFSKRKLHKLCVGRWGPVSLWMCVLSSALICNALAWRRSRRRDKTFFYLESFVHEYTSVYVSRPHALPTWLHYYIARRFRIIRPPPLDFPCVWHTPYNIGDTNIV